MYVCNDNHTHASAIDLVQRQFKKNQLPFRTVLGCKHKTTILVRSVARMRATCNTNVHFVAGCQMRWVNSRIILILSLSLSSRFNSKTTIKKCVLPVHLWRWWRSGRGPKKSTFLRWRHITTVPCWNIYFRDDTCECVHVWGTNFAATESRLCSRHIYDSFDTCCSCQSFVVIEEQWECARIEKNNRNCQNSWNTVKRRTFY